MPQSNYSEKSNQSEHLSKLLDLIDEKAKEASARNVRREVGVRELFSDYRARHPDCPPEEPALTFESVQAQLAKGYYVDNIRVAYNGFANVIVLERVPEPEALERLVEIAQGRFLQELDDQIDSLTGFQFQIAVSEILRNLPWVLEVSDTQLTADGGVDFSVLVHDEVFGDVLAMGQVKKTKAKVGASAVRDFIGSLVTADPRPKVGIYVSLSGFTGPAKRAKEASPIHIRTVERNEFIEWLRKYEIGVKSKGLTVMSLDTNFWNEIREIQP